MTAEQERLMDKYGISVAHETFYRFEEFRYRRLEDALNYAMKQAASGGDPGPKRNRVD